MHNILLLDGFSPTKNQRTSCQLYHDYLQQQAPSLHIQSQPLTMQSHQLMTADHDCIVISGHGLFEAGKHYIQTAHGCLDLQYLFNQSDVNLHQCVIIVDACYLGQELERLHQCSDALAMVGFEYLVEATAVTSCVLLLLKTLLNDLPLTQFEQNQPVLSQGLGLCMALKAHH